MVRFAVEQNDAIRACDNAKGSKHNACKSVGDKLLHVCEKADMPQALAELFYTLLGGEAECRGCTDDIEKAYWRVPNSQPEFSVVVQMDLDGPNGPRVVLLRIPGHSFGLVSAVTNVNSLAEFTTHCSRWIGRAACGRYYDDLFIIDPRRGRDSAKEALHWMQGKLGIPLTREVAKCIPMGPSELCSLHGSSDTLRALCARPPWAGCEGGSH